MSIEQLEYRWHQLMHHLAAPPQYNIPLWQEIQLAYSAKNRHYHNLNHLADLFRQADQFKDQIEDFDTFQLSIWYHDIIYNVLRKDNEIKSAIFAKYRLEAIKYSREKLVRCYEQINATKTHQLTTITDTDTAYLLDFDLSMLGRDWETYLNYTQQIRAEYAVFPNFLYKKGRKKVLTHFLEAESIFQTAHYYQLFEAQARANLKRELELLK